MIGTWEQTICARRWQYCLKPPCTEFSDSVQDFFVTDCYVIKNPHLLRMRGFAVVMSLRSDVAEWVDLRAVLDDFKVKMDTSGTANASSVALLGNNLTLGHFIASVYVKR